jgi:hypothetical protein
MVNQGDGGRGKDGQGQPMQESVRTWVMAALTFIFVALYAAALFGLVPGPGASALQTATRIESIVFVIIGYYFGRLPAQATERTLKGEIQRQSGKAEDAEEKKSASQQETQALREKVKNTRAVLASTVPKAAVSSDGLAATLGKTTPPVDTLRQSVLAAVNVLDS